MASELFPQYGSDQGGTGAAVVGFDVATQVGAPSQLDGYIGIMDTSTAAYYGLPMVNIVQPDGQVTSPTTATLSQAALRHLTINSDGSLSTDFTAVDDSAWPMLLPTEMMVRTDTYSPQSPTIASFLKYATGPGQGNLPAGYAPLTPQLAQLADDTIAKIPTAPPAPTAFTPTASPSGPLSNASIPLGAVSAASATSPAQPKTPAHGATATGAELLLASGAGRALLVLAGVAVAALFAGAAAEIVGRRRRAPSPAGPEPS